MLDTAQKRATLMRHLEGAMALAHELNEPTTEYLIERAIDEARAQQIPSLMIGDVSQRPGR
jgi:murein endopeptidase